MFDDDSTAENVQGSAAAESVRAWVTSVTAGLRPPEMVRVDAQLRRLAKTYVAFEAELARWLREAQRVKVWKLAGCASLPE